MHTFHLFDVVGVELEYMIVDEHSLNVRPITDKVLYAIAGQYLTEVECGKVSYSNELALHVIELKTTEPQRTLDGLQNLFQDHVVKINTLLKQYGAMLLPTACHPWMNPLSEMRLWPHEQSPIYEAYNRLFDCRGHGWANLQSAHINLPFHGDKEFFALHSAIRCLLPLLPALAASSPILEGRLADKLDKRLDVYQYNQKRFPFIAGDIVPEAIASPLEYQSHILQPMYEMIKPHDPEGILQYEWLNSRGAIARFDRNTIEIRVLDIQECPRADIAIAEAIIYVLRRVIEEKWSPAGTWKSVPQKSLVRVLHACIDKADSALIDDGAYLNVFGIDRPLSAQALWRYLLTDFLERGDNDVLERILRDGPLAKRMVRAYEQNATRQGLRELFQKLAHCLAAGELF